MATKVSDGSKISTLIVYAHPDTGGHCKAILSAVEEGLKDRKEAYSLLDLYKKGFDPVLRKEEHYTSGNKAISDETKKIQEMILAASRLIFIYPLWWGSMPAILKGFFDKVFTPHFAFEFRNSTPRGLLKGKKAVVFLTSGSPVFLTKIVRGNRAVANISSDILDYSGIKARVFQLGRALKYGPGKDAAIRRMVRQGLGWLFGRAVFS